MPELGRETISKQLAPLHLFGVALIGIVISAGIAGCGSGSSTPGPTPTPTPNPVAHSAYIRTNLVSDVSGAAPVFDANMTFPIGLVHAPASPWWMANFGSNTATLHTGTGAAVALVVSVSTAHNAEPIGIVFNGGTNFIVTDGTHTGPALFIFANRNGTISGWSPSVAMTQAETAIDTSGAASFAGLALLNVDAADVLLAVNTSTGQVNEFNSSFATVALPASAFADGTAHPQNIMAIGGKLYVTFAEGFVDVFDGHGNLLLKLDRTANLTAPWGVAQAPGAFGDFSNDILVSDTATGKIAGFDPTSGSFKGFLSDSSGTPLSISGIHSIGVGNDGSAGPSTTLFFTAGETALQPSFFGTIMLVP